MSRLYTFGTWSFSSLAIALALLVPLTVPEGALADAGSDCANQCSPGCNTQCNGNPSCYSTCMGNCAGNCCNIECGGEQTCGSTCCQEACGGDSNCVQACSALQGKNGCGGDPCSIPNNPCKANWWPQCPDTNTNCANSAPPRTDCTGCICRDWGIQPPKCACRLKP